MAGTKSDPPPSIRPSKPGAMFYTPSKVLTFLLQPSSALWLAIAAGFFLREWRPRWHRTGLVVSVISLVALFIAGLSPVSNALLLPLEDRFPAGQVNSVKKPVTGIIVLGGAEDGVGGRTAVRDSRVASLRRGSEAWNRASLIRLPA